MVKLKIKKKCLIFILAALMGPVLPSLSACTGNQIKSIQGIIQEVEVANRTFTILATTQDLVKLGINNNTQVKINGRYRDVTCLEAGLNVRVEARGQSAELIEVNLAQVDADIVNVGDSQITVEPVGSGQQIILKIKPFSLIYQNDADVELNILRPGRIAKVYFCTASGTAYEINEMPEDYIVEKAPEGSRLEGVVTKYRLNELTVTPIGGVDRKITLSENTIITFQDKSPATKDDILYWDWVTVYFSPITGIATRIEVKPVSSLRTTKPR